MANYTNDAALTGLADGATVTSSNTGGGTNTAFNLVDGTVTVSTSHPDSHTTKGYHVAATAAALCDVRLPLGAGTANNAFRTYFYLTGTVAPTTTQEFIQLGSTGQNYIGVMNTGVVRIQLAGTGVFTSTYTLLANTLYRLEVWWTIAASGAQFHYALYLGDSGTPVDSYDTTTGNTGTSNPTMIYIGKHTSTGNWTDVYFSSVAANDTGGGFIGVPASNTAPTANAGPDQTGVEPYATVTLDGTGSSDPDGTIASYAWTQTAGTTVTLSSSTASQPTFTAPATVAGSTLTFSLVVTDNGGASSTADTVNVTILPHTIFRIDSGGPTPIQVSRL